MTDSGDLPKSLEGCTTKKEIVDYILEREKHYTDLIFAEFLKRSNQLSSWYNLANSAKETWSGKMKIDPRNDTESFGSVSEVVFIAGIHKYFEEWVPAGLPIGSDTRVLTDDAVIHIDIKTHREGDSDLNRTQDVRPEQMSGAGDYKTLFRQWFPSINEFVNDEKGKLGDMPPKLPPYYDFGTGATRLTITLSVICAYLVRPKSNAHILSRIQLVCVPNGFLRELVDYKDIFQVGKDGRDAHRYRVNLRDLKRHEEWRWRRMRLRTKPRFRVREN